jgi:hypothetical protein
MAAVLLFLAGYAIGSLATLLLIGLMRGAGQRASQGEARVRRGGG